MRKPRPSPAVSATLFAVGTHKRGGDGRMYVVVATRNGVQRWQPSSHWRTVAKSFPEREVHVIDNGGIPFIVELSSVPGPGAARISVQSAESGKAMYRHWKTLPYRRVWIGRDPHEDDPSKETEWWYGGNSVLLQVAPRTYVFIGGEIFRFSTRDDIQEYISPMGNNHVPYPYAVGRVNTYLVVEKTWIPNRMWKARDDPYDVFYGMDQDVQNRHQRSHALQAYAVLHQRV